MPPEPKPEPGSARVVSRVLLAVHAVVADRELSRVARWKHRRLRIIEKRRGDAAKVTSIRDLLRGLPDR